MKIDGLETIARAVKGLQRIKDANARAAYRAVNSVSSKVATQSRREIGEQINLPQSYIRDQTTVTKASTDRPIAIIKMRKRPVRMARFGARQLTAPVRGPRGARGDSSRGIPSGRKAAGVSVRISRSGGRTSRRSGFLIPLRAGNVDGGNGLGLFVRTGKGPTAIKHKYGPSPDQLFRRWRSQAAPDIKTMLAEAYASQLKYELQGSRR